MRNNKEIDNSTKQKKMARKKDKKGRKSLFKRLGRAEAVSLPPSPSHSPTNDTLSTVLDAKVTVTANFDVKDEGRKVPDPVRKNRFWQ